MKPAQIASILCILCLLFTTSCGKVSNRPSTDSVVYTEQSSTKTDNTENSNQSSMNNQDKEEAIINDVSSSSSNDLLVTNPSPSISSSPETDNNASSSDIVTQDDLKRSLCDIAKTGGTIEQISFRNASTLRNFAFQPHSSIANQLTTLLETMEYSLSKATENDLNLSNNPTFRYVITSNSSKDVIELYDGEKDKVFYITENAQYVVSGNIDIISEFVRNVRLIYSNLENDYTKLYFTAKNDEEVVNSFATSIFPEFMMELSDANLYKIIDFSVLKSKLIEADPSLGLIKANYEFAVKPYDERFNALYAENTTLGTGEYSGWIIMKLQVIFEFINDKWNCADIKRLSDIVGNIY